MTVVDTLRRFNRTYTQRVGVLEESHLGTGRTLGASRLLYEVDGEVGSTVGELRDLLGLDSGYVARLLRALESDGLVATEPDPADRRRRRVVLTDAGRAARADLDQRSEDLAARLVAPLTPRQQARLGDALATAELLVRAATVELREVDPADPASVRAARTALDRYVAEVADRLPGGFAPSGLDAVEPGSTWVVATSDGRPAAYGGIRPLDLPVGVAGDGPAVEVKRMWVDPAWRGAGLGGRMLRHLEELAREQGATRIALDTNSALDEAVALYDRAGYARVERYNDNADAELFFAKRLGPQRGVQTPTT